MADRIPQSQSDFSIPKIVSPIPRTRLLVVDDDPSIKNFIAHLLSMYWEVETAEDGMAGLSAAERQPPDLIVSDIRMPVLDGCEMVKRLRAHNATSNIPVILISSTEDEDAGRIIAMEAGANDFVAKPFSPTELVIRVRRLLRKREIHSEPALHIRP